MPKSRAEYWRAKFEANVARDARNTEALRKQGWRVEFVWECETRDASGLRERLREIVLGPSAK